MSDRRSTALRLNIWTLRFARNWVRVALIAIGTFALLPWLAPLLMSAGLEAPARVIYSAYSPFCHQFAFRSFFFGGEQFAYPRALAESGLTPYEAYIERSPAFSEELNDWIDALNGGFFETVEDFNPFLWSPELQFASRDFIGDPTMGYKTALCQRDLAIYAALTLFAAVYSIPVVRRRLRPIPLLLYVFLGLGPIGLDGFSQLLGYPPFGTWFSLPERETLPQFRVLTGFIFGLCSGWLGFTYLEESFQQTRAVLEAKLKGAGIDV